MINTYTQGQTDKFNNYSAKIDAGAGGKLSDRTLSGRTQILCDCTEANWSPANTPQLKKAAIRAYFQND